MSAWRPIQALETRLASANAAISRCSSGLRFTERRCVDGIAMWGRVYQVYARCSTLMQTTRRGALCQLPGSALSFIPVNEERKVPPGKKLGELVSTEAKPLTSTVSVVWAESPDKAILWESEPSLRQKIAGAEGPCRHVAGHRSGSGCGNCRGSPAGSPSRYRRLDQPLERDLHGGRGRRHSREPPPLAVTLRSAQAQPARGEQVQL